MIDYYVVGPFIHTLGNLYSYWMPKILYTVYFDNFEDFVQRECVGNSSVDFINKPKTRILSVHNNNILLTNGLLNKYW